MVRGPFFPKKRGDFWGPLRFDLMPATHAGESLSDSLRSSSAGDPPRAAERRPRLLRSRFSLVFALQKHQTSLRPHACEPRRWLARGLASLVLGRGRTCGLKLRRLPLYPLSYEDIKKQQDFTLYLTETSKENSLLDGSAVEGKNGARCEFSAIPIDDPPLGIEGHFFPFF